MNERVGQWMSRLFAAGIVAGATIALVGMPVPLPRPYQEALLMCSATLCAPERSHGIDLAIGFRPDPRSGARRLVPLTEEPLPPGAEAALRRWTEAISERIGSLDSIAWCESAPDGRAIAAGIAPLSADDRETLPNTWIWPDWRTPSKVIACADLIGVRFLSPSIAQLFGSDRTPERPARVLDLRRPNHHIELPMVREGTLRAVDNGRWAAVMHDGTLVTGILPGADTHESGSAPTVIPIEGTINDLAMLHGGRILIVNIESANGIPDLAVIRLEKFDTGAPTSPLVTARRTGLLQPVWGRAAPNALLIRTGHRGEHPIALMVADSDGAVRTESVGFDPLTEFPISISPSGNLVAVKRYARPTGEYHAIRGLRPQTPPGDGQTITPSLLEPRVLWLRWEEEVRRR